MLSHFPFIVLSFAFFGDSLVSGSVLTALWRIALLEGVCWNSGSCASMRNAPDTEFKVHSLLLLLSRAFYVYPLLFRSLRYIYESLYRSYPSVCLCRLQRQPESYSLSYSDHANNLSLLIRFQHKRIPVLSGWVSLIYTPVASLSGFVPPPS